MPTINAFVEVHSTVQSSCLWEGKSRGGREGKSCHWEMTRDGRRRRRRRRRQLRVVHEEGGMMESDNLITQAREFSITANECPSKMLWQFLALSQNPPHQKKSFFCHRNQRD